MIMKSARVRRMRKLFNRNNSVERYTRSYLRSRVREESASIRARHNVSILIINPGGWQNKGDIANRIGMISALKREFGDDVKISVECSTPDKSRKYFKQFGAETVPSILPLRTSVWNMARSFMKSMFKLLLCGVVFRITGTIPIGILDDVESNYLRRVLRSDIILSSAGGFIHDENPLVVLIPQLSLIALPLLLKKRPIILYAQSIGPFRNRLSKILVGLMLDRLDLIILREEISRRILAEMNVRRPKVYVTADAAFSFPISPLRSSALRKPGVGPFVGITVIGKWYGPGKASDNYIVAMARVIDYMVKNLQSEVYILPQQLSYADVSVMKKVYDLTEEASKNHVHLILKDYTPLELMELISEFDFLIGTRMHSNIFALRMGVPVIAISYQPKTEGIMKMVGLGKWTIPINDITADKVAESICALLKNKDELKRLLKEKVQVLVSRSYLSAKLVKEYWEKLNDSSKV